MIPISEKSTLEKKTGSWRASNPVISDKCTGCGICVSLCPEGCIKIEAVKGKKRAVIDYDYCKGCLICKDECPAKAVTVEK